MLSWIRIRRWKERFSWNSRQLQKNSDEFETLFYVAYDLERRKNHRREALVNEIDCENIENKVFIHFLRW